MVEIGERVLVHAVGRLNDGMKFLDTYKVGEPMDFVVGSRTVLPTFERAVSQMAPGDSQPFILHPKRATVPMTRVWLRKCRRRNFPELCSFPVGQFIEIALPSGSMRVKVLPPKDGMVRLDVQRDRVELAGRELIFDIELVGTSRGTPIDAKSTPQAADAVRRP